MFFWCSRCTYQQLLWSDNNIFYNRVILNNRFKRLADKIKTSTFSNQNIVRTAFCVIYCHLLSTVCNWNDLITSRRRRCRVFYFKYFHLSPKHTVFVLILFIFLIFLRTQHMVYNTLNIHSVLTYYNDYNIELKRPATISIIRLTTTSVQNPFCNN